MATIENEYQQILPKMSGYLEKKGRKKMMSCFKKYWFVLEGRLLLYYKSKDEYGAISPCKGSINLGPTCNVKPGTPNSGIFQIESKTTTITLRAQTKEDQREWMQALMSALNPKNNDYKKMNHFRYSTGELSPELRKHFEGKIVERASPESDNRKIIEKLQKIGAKSYGVGPKIENNLERQFSLSDESIVNNFQTRQRNRTELFSKSSSIIVENEAYCKLDFNKRINSVESDADASSEDLYERIPSSDSVFIKKDSRGLIMENDVYWRKREQPKKENCYETIDYNENNIKSHENIYAEAEINRNSVEYVEIEEPKKSTSSQRTDEDKRRLFKFTRKSKSLKEKPEQQQKQQTKLRKSESFLHRVWHKRTNKQKKIKKDHISLSTNNIPDKASMSEEESIKTLTELHHILEKKLLNEKQLRDVISAGRTVVSETEKMVFDLGSDQQKVDNSESAQEGTITLPSRNEKSHYEKIPPLVPPKIKRKSKTQLDDILSELNKQSEFIDNVQKSEGKVRDLIKRFSVEQEEVELRPKDPDWKSKCSTDCNDLDKLIADLAKVTTAPILTPGVTTSLINPEIPDDEIQCLLPIRRRRMSDPDYDIPRPHRSLTNVRRKDDNALEATRFFGPILKSSDYQRLEEFHRPLTPPVDYSNLPSITPDSLEMETIGIDMSSHDELRKASFESHNYSNYKKTSHQNLKRLIEDDFYADPRLLLKPGNSTSQIQSDLFEDSLDP